MAAPEDDEQAQVGVERSLLSYGLLCLGWSLGGSKQRLYTVEASCDCQEPTQSEQVRVPEHQRRLRPGQLEEASSRPQRKSQRVEERSLTEAGVRTLVTVIGRNRYTGEQRLGDAVQI